MLLLWAIIVTGAAHFKHAEPVSACKTSQI